MSDKPRVFILQEHLPCNIKDGVCLAHGGNKIKLAQCIVAEQNICIVRLLWENSQRIKELEAENKALQAKLTRSLTAVTFEHITKIEAENKQLVHGLKEAISQVEDWAIYAPPYFQKKHDLEGCIRVLKTFLPLDKGDRQ